MGKANFLPGKIRRKIKTSNSLHQHFLLDKFTTFPTTLPLKYQHGKTTAEKTIVRQVLLALHNKEIHNTWTEKSLNSTLWLNKQETREYSCFSCKVATWPLAHILTYHESHFTDRETEVTTFL